MSILKAVLKDQLFEWQKILLFSKGKFSLSLLIISQFDVTFLCLLFFSFKQHTLMFFKTASIFIVLWLAFFTNQYSTDISIHMYLFPLHWTSQSLFFQLLFPFRFLLFKQCCGNHACRYMHALFCIMLLLFPQDVLFKVELLNQKGMYILNFNKF